MEAKAVDYIAHTDGDIRAVLVLNLNYPGADKAEVGLFVADTSSDEGSLGRWVLRSSTVHDDNLDEQPAGQVHLYLSDFLGRAGLPTASTRPSATELADEITRFVPFPRVFSTHNAMMLTLSPSRSEPQIILTYKQLRAIFL